MTYHWRELGCSPGVNTLKGLQRYPVRFQSVKTEKRH
jgi:hypothetical protein